MGTIVDSLLRPMVLVLHLLSEQLNFITEMILGKVYLLHLQLSEFKRTFTTKVPIFLQINYKELALTVQK